MSQWHGARGGWGRGRGRGFSGRSSTKKKGGNHIPERWKDYLPVGQRMPGTRFIAFKVPLKKDLPETIPYLKIFTIGHQVPDDDTIFKFKCAVNGFLKENKDNDRLIGVHCTHGLNRTGYLICRYLIDVQGMRPDNAIELFNRCRGHCIERQNYIEDLLNGPIRRDRNSSVSRSRGFEYSTYMMEPAQTTNKAVNHRPRNNVHWTQGYPTPSRHFHTQTQDLQQSVRKFSQNQNIYQRGHNPPPGPPGEDYSQRRYSWNVQPNANQAVQSQRWCPGSYYGLPYPAYYGWTE
ncbi:RNA/RNP complex-1-interacting phosphatase isoform X3 [Molossus molossus]|uniref:RNA/RNP complex-1-interacting phosphatase isoform X3 n=1 Tax=Molossus molossus TaxID=27622 RepID=UPI0017470B27|nr:RNA/RNP complex-1-interacting phosphatase isoform X3 [Molossus molossus]